MTTDAALVDLAALGDDFTRDPFPVYAALRARGPVHHVRMPEGHTAWLVVGYEAGRAALADPALSKDWRNIAPDLGIFRISSGVSMLSTDPPVHTRLRRLIAREFTMRRVERLAPQVQRITDDLLDAMLPLGAADLVDAFSFPLPITVIGELLGVPFLARDSFRDWSNTALSSNEQAEREEAANRLTQYLVELLAQKREQPGDDLMSGLIHAADTGDDDRLTPEELIGMAWLLLVAGHETTVNLITSGVLALLTHPDQLALLRARPELIDDAVEEMLRWDGPVETPTYRFTTGPYRVGGTTVPGGGQVVLVAMADANRDPDRFPDPGRFDITRDARGHLAFGHGIHFCLGAPLARLEARVAVRSLLERCPDLALDAHPAALSWRGGMLIRGPERLPVRW
ncbi:cytochrome P450 family protein [Streptomyces genisteinicus]|uniref:Cytochrome P450 n=1 Tax=Streptomyces genisteinicus TaxID=2768068 RepID=A0A7H0I078_9ACTN|nr:cytochrome P450 [Streptomyces genisteinicus]QNP66194.1 cytochrome P450 [Streptomyces genisteinicus]